MSKNKQETTALSSTEAIIKRDNDERADGDKIKIAVNEEDLIEVHNILEKIIAPEAPYSRDELQFAQNTIEVMIKNGHRIKEILSRYTQRTL